MKNTDNKNSDSRTALIRVIKTPLSFFVLIALIVEVILGALAVNTTGAIQEKSLFGMIALLIILILVVLVLTITKPQALLGKLPMLNYKSELSSKIEGYWWQYVQNTDEGPVLSILKIYQSQVSSQLKIEGRAWTIEGKNKVDYKSRAIALDEENKTLFYYWKGNHPKESSVPEYFGAGVIMFEESDTKKIINASGWYSATLLKECDKTLKKGTEYLRATEGDVKIIYGKNQDTIADKISEQINRLKKMQGAQVLNSIPEPKITPQSSLESILELYNNKTILQFYNDLVAIGTWPEPDLISHSGGKNTQNKQQEESLKIDTVPIPDRPKKLRDLIFELLEKYRDTKINNLFKVSNKELIY